MTWVDIFLLVVGTWGITEFLRHSHITQEAAMYWREDVDNPLSSFLLKVHECGFCLSHWAAIIGLLLWLFPFGIYILTIFALTRAANVLNDICWWITRTPNRKNNAKNPNQ